MITSDMTLLIFKIEKYRQHIVNVNIYIRYIDKYDNHKLLFKTDGLNEV